MLRGLRSLRQTSKRLLFPHAPLEAQAKARTHQWSIGVYVGDSPLSLSPLPGAKNPVLTAADVTDVEAAIIADPFMLNVDRTWYMFFEVFDLQSRRGVIGLAISTDTFHWTYQQVVLAEEFHLSYPYVFRLGSDYYMIPEAYQSKSIRLYRAAEFPTRWSLVKTLLGGQEYVDPSIFYFRDRWWLFAGFGTPSMRADGLRLFYADELLSPWREHPKSPIVTSNERIARPAGRVVVNRDRIIRFAQDSFPAYGSQVRAFEISELTTDAYSEHEVEESPVLSGTGSGWNKSGMHHLDPHLLGDNRWIACVDGWASTES